MSRLVNLLLFAFAGAAVAAAQSREAIEEAECPCKKQDQSYLVYDRPEELVQLIEIGTRPYLLLDVRGLAEYEQGHIESAVSMPLAQLVEKGLTVPKDTLIIVYCASGIRSGMAVNYLKDQGYTKVVDFGSVSRWPGERVVRAPETGEGGASAR